MIYPSPVAIRVRTREGAKQNRGLNDDPIAPIQTSRQLYTQSPGYLQHSGDTGTKDIPQKQWYGFLVYIYYFC